MNGTRVAELHDHLLAVGPEPSAGRMQARLPAKCAASGAVQS